MVSLSFCFFAVLPEIPSWDYNAGNCSFEMRFSQGISLWEALRGAFLFENESYFMKKSF